MEKHSSRERTDMIMTLIHHYRMGSSLQNANHKGSMIIEAALHINCLELLAVTLAMRSFVKKQIQVKHSTED